MKGKLKAMDLNKTLGSKSSHYKDNDRINIQEQAMSIVILDLDTLILKHMNEYDEYTLLIESFHQLFHCRELSNMFYYSLKLMSFKIKDYGTKI